MISIANEHGYIEAQCPYGRRHNLACRQSLGSSELWAVVEEDKIRPILTPVLRCVWHTTNNISKIYGWKDDGDKFIKGSNDIINNYYRMWTLIPWNAAPRGWKSWDKQRYHFSDSALEQFIDNFVFESLVLCHPFIQYDMI